MKISARPPPLRKILGAPLPALTAPVHIRRLTAFSTRDAPDSGFRYPVGYRIGRIVKKLSGRIVSDVTHNWKKEEQRLASYRLGSQITGPKPATPWRILFTTGKRGLRTVQSRKTIAYVNYYIGRVRCLPDDEDSSSSGPKMPFDIARTTKILRDVT